MKGLKKMRRFKKVANFILWLILWGLYKLFRLIIIIFVYIGAGFDYISDSILTCANLLKK